MAPTFGNVKDLAEGRSKFALKLRVVRVYEQPQFHNKNEIASLECVMHDGTGMRVHVTVQKRDMQKFKDILSVGKIFAIMKFVVRKNNFRYNTADTRQKILLFKYTEIFETEDTKFPMALYNFKRFEEISVMEDTLTCKLFDVIGAIVCSYKPETKQINGKMLKLMNIVLEDEQGKTMACTLWEEYADELTAYKAKKKSSEEELDVKNDKGKEIGKEATENESEDEDSCNSTVSSQLSESPAMKKSRKAI